MELTLYQIDAFAQRLFEGNPAAICPLEEWLPDETMQSIAAENNLSETAFFVPSGDGYHIRWFTPVHEVDVCGHATLTSAWVLLNLLDHEAQNLIFQSKSGPLTVRREQRWLEMNFPAQAPSACEIPPAANRAFTVRPRACVKHQEHMFIFDHEEEVTDASPDLSALRELNLRGVVIAARSGSCDFVARFFAPKYGIDEDPVTGPAFTQLIPYWPDVLGKTRLTARQVSKRGGNVRCVMQGEWVRISGQAVKYMTGTIPL
jgi:predicted PhzF superfamily epimerase YddE/YHI9